MEFKISSRSYTFRYGDGTSSGQVQDAGGGYPDGAIKHTYGKPIEAAKVTVDSQLTGEFRVNGGTWIDIDTIADLQDEPVTTLAVRSRIQQRRLSSPAPRRPPPLRRAAHPVA